MPGGRGSTSSRELIAFDKGLGMKGIAISRRIESTGTTHRARGSSREPSRHPSIETICPLVMIMVVIVVVQDHLRRSTQRNKIATGPILEIQIVLSSSCGASNPSSLLLLLGGCR